MLSHTGMHSQKRIPQAKAHTGSGWLSSCQAQTLHAYQLSQKVFKASRRNGTRQQTCNSKSSAHAHTDAEIAVHEEQVMQWQQQVHISGSAQLLQHAHTCSIGDPLQASGRREIRIQSRTCGVVPGCLACGVCKANQLSGHETAVDVQVRPELIDTTTSSTRLARTHVPRRPC